jgi:hypothetical protein
VLGAIPGRKAGGAWARSIGLAFVHFCRRNPQEAMKGTLTPTREELLSQFPAKETPYTAFLDATQPASKNPNRLLKYWTEALQILVDIGILAGEGEALRTEAWFRESLKGKYRWVEAWLKEAVLLRPGQRLAETLDERARALPAPPATAPPRRRGRPPRRTAS